MEPETARQKHNLPKGKERTQRIRGYTRAKHLFYKFQALLYVWRRAVWYYGLGTFKMKCVLIDMHAYIVSICPYVYISLACIRYIQLYMYMMQIYKPPIPPPLTNTSHRIFLKECVESWKHIWQCPIFLTSNQCYISFSSCYYYT